MSDRAYQLMEIVLDKEVDENFKCGICMDILRSPILCGAGHSWCLDCIRLNNKTKCPMCPETINYKKPSQNFSIKSMIDKMMCRCPHNNSIVSNNLIGDTENNDYDNNNNNNSNKKRKTSSSSRNSNNNDSDELCKWTGRYDQLDTHMKSCPSIPCPCAFAMHGCDFIGNKKLLEDHYMYNSHVHNIMLANEISSLKNSSKLDKVIISQQNQKLVQAESMIRELQESSEKSYTIQWTIDGVMEKIRNKTEVVSDDFDMITKNGNKYAILTGAKFGRGDNGKLLVLAIYHRPLPGYSNEMPINLSGSIFELFHEDPTKNITINLSGKIKQANQGHGAKVCNDLVDEGFVKNNQIIVKITIKLNKTIKEISSL